MEGRKIRNDECGICKPICLGLNRVLDLPYFVFVQFWSYKKWSATSNVIGRNAPASPRDESIVIPAKWRIGQFVVIGLIALVALYYATIGWPKREAGKRRCRFASNLRFRRFRGSGRFDMAHDADGRRDRPGDVS